MRRYLITGEAGPVNTLADILADDEGPYRWAAINDDGSSPAALPPAALLDLAHAMREWQKTTPGATIAFCFPGITPPAAFLEAWEGIPWHCATYHEDLPCGIRQGSGPYCLQLAATWGECVAFLLEAGRLELRPA